VVKAELGTKRICESCSAKFYDLNRDPIICPKCGSVFEIVVMDTVIPEESPKKPEDKNPINSDDDDDDDLDTNPDIISLEDAEDNDDDIPDDIPDFEDDDSIEADDSDTFLETDDDDDDGVVGIITPSERNDDDH